jgi:transcriptional regulator with XRE-family HTH domain
MVDHLNWRPFSELDTLDQDEIDDAEFRPRDRAWAGLVRLFNERKRLEGLTYEQLGDRIGKPRAQVHRWLSSSMKTTMKSLGLLAEGLDADLVIDIIPRIEHDTSTNQAHPSEFAKVLVQLKSIYSDTVSLRPAGGSGKSRILVPSAADEESFSFAVGRKETLSESEPRKAELML